MLIKQCNLYFDKSKGSQTRPNELQRHPQRYGNISITQKPDNMKDLPLVFMFPTCGEGVGGRG